MRILLLVLQYPPDINPTGVLMAQLCEGLRDRGHEVSVLTTFPHYDTFRIQDAYRGKLAERRKDNGIDVLRLYVYAPGRKTVVNRLVSYLSFSILAALADLIDRTPYDIILCPNGGFITGLTAYFSSLHKRVPFVYNVQDLYPDVPMQTGDLKNRQAISVLRQLERYMYHTARHITVVSATMRKILLARGVPDQKVTHIPNFVDTDFIRPVPRQNDFSQQHGLDDKFVLNYAGNIGSVYDFDTLLDVAGQLSSYPDILFLLIGDGVRKKEIAQRAAHRGLENVRFLPYHPRAEVPWIRGASDVQLSLYRTGSAQFSLSSKIYEIMASGRPLLAAADRDSDVWDIVRTTGCGICIEPEQPEQLMDAIMMLYRNRSECEIMGQRGRQEAEKRFSKETVVRQYEQVLQNVINLKMDVQ